MKKILTYSFLIWFALQGLALQAQFFSYHKYDIENSAAEGDILQVQQDHNGIMWWVNDEYFTRYNGINYQTINYGDLAINYQNAQPYIDNHGDLWLCVWQKSKVEVYGYTDGKWQRQTTIVLGESETVTDFYATTLSGSTWIVITTPKRMLAWENKNWQELLLDDTKTIYKQQAAGNTIYTYTDAGLFITRYGKAPYKLAIVDEVLNNIKVLAIHENIWVNGSEPQLWIVTDKLIGYIKNNTLTVVKIFNAEQNTDFTKICSTGEGQLFLLNTQNQVWQLNINTKTLVQLEGIGANGKIQETVNQLFTDRENNLWIAVEDGLIKTAHQNISFITRKQNMGSLPVQAVAKRGNSIIAAGPKGINLYGGDNQIQYYPYTNPQLSNPRQSIRQLKADSLGNIWLLSNTQGLWYTNNLAEWTCLAKDNTNNNNIIAFEIDPNGILYVINLGGLYEAQPQGLRLIAKLPDGAKPNNIAWYNGSLILLSSKGVYRLSGKRWAKLVQENGSNFNTPAYALEKVYENLAILGTEKGIYYLKEFDLVRYKTDSLWAEMPYYDVAIDGNGAVWLTADTGVVVMDKKGAPKVFAYNGMQFKKTYNSSLVSCNVGHVYISMRTGLMVYSPEYKKQILNKPILQVSAIETREIKKANFNSSSVIELESGDNDITFFFDANSFIDETKNKLLYTLEGYMSDWEEITSLNQNSISFKNLPSGRYVLKMQLVNANGIASEIISSPIVNILKPFYNQWWFYAAAILAFFGISFSVFYLYGQKKFEKDLLSEVDKRSRELRSSEDRFRTLWENTSDALILYNIKGDIILYNPTLLDVVGKAKNTIDLTGNKIYDVLKIADNNMSEKEFRHNLETQQLKPRLELTTLQDNGSEVVLEFSNTYLLLPNEKAWVVLSILRNITQRKQTEENLIAAKNEAEQASRVKSAFLATMSHEIRTPLNAIIGMSSVMRNTRLSDEQRNYVSAIKTSSDSLLSLVNNILDFSKIEAGMMMIEKTDVMPEDCVSETLEILGNLANEKGIYLFYRIHPDVPVKILSDKTRLRQVLINLVGNAIKFTEKGYIEIAIQPLTNHQLKISVTDTGIGIPTDKLSNLFKVFTQVDDSTTRKYGGTGLGLAITDKLVNLLGGYIKVASQPGKGSQFTFTITDFSNGKYTTRRNNTIQKYPEVKIAVVTPSKAVAHIVRTLNDERAIKTVVVKTLDEAAQIANTVNSILVDAENFSETTIPAALQGKELFVIKRYLHQLSASITQLLAINEKRTINLPINSKAYQRVLDRVIKLKENKTEALEVVEKEILGKSIPLSVLVVDDNKVNLMMMEVIMKNLGYAIDFANNGKEAVAQCTANNYDLVFMDLQMPEMDGIEATTVIKETLPPEKFPQIVALTANAFPEDKQACLDAGMMDFLPKPVTIDTIRNLILKTFAPEVVEEK